MTQKSSCPPRVGSACCDNLNGLARGMEPKRPADNRKLQPGYELWSSADGAPPRRPISAVEWGLGWLPAFTELCISL